MTINAQLCGMIGGAGLIVAAFAPVVSLPIVGTLSPFALHWAAGVALLVFGVAAVVAGLTEKPRAVGLTGIVSALYVAAGVIYYFVRRAELASSLAEDELSADNPFAGLAQEISEMALASVSLSWGIAIIVLASLVLLSTFAQKRPDTPTGAAAASSS